MNSLDLWAVPGDNLDLWAVLVDSLDLWAVLVDNPDLWAVQDNHDRAMLPDAYHRVAVVVAACQGEAVPPAFGPRIDAGLAARLPQASAQTVQWPHCP